MTTSSPWSCVWGGIPSKALVAGLLAVGSIAGCRVRSVNAPAPVPVDPPAATGTESTGVSTQPAILSAHLEAVDLPSLDRLDALPVLFSSDLDAASLEATSFMVMFADGSRVVPDEARLAPASENDENRTVLLIGDFGDPQSRPPTDVMITGRVYGEQGESFEGLVAKVDPFAARGRVVVAQTVTVSAGTCDGFAQAVRTFWSDGLRGVEAADLAEIRVELEDGTATTPQKFDDHDLEDQRREDNVLDLCISQDAPVRRLQIREGVFEDPAGHASAAATVEIGASAG